MRTLLSDRERERGEVRDAERSREEMEDAFSDREWLQVLPLASPRGVAARRSLRSLLVRGLVRGLGARASSAAEVEDFAQEALISVLGNLDSFRCESRFTTWALAIAMRAALTQLRRKQWQNVSFDALIADADDLLPAACVDGRRNGEREVERLRLLSTVESAFRTALSLRQRTVLVAELRGMPQSELAAKLGVTRAALYKLGYDARKNLKKSLESAGITIEEIDWVFG